jgi:acetyl-CoA carboxylase biotin carboxyl carrier protein
MELTPEDVEEILALLDSLPYDELDLQTPRFRLTLTRTPAGWTQSTRQSSSTHHSPSARQSPSPTPPTNPTFQDMSGHQQPGEESGASLSKGGAGLVEVRAPLPGTFYRAPRPGAEPFVEVGSRVGEQTVVGIVETMKLFNPVHAGTRGRVAEICAGNAEFTPGGGALMRIRTET